MSCTSRRIAVPISAVVMVWPIAHMIDIVCARTIGAFFITCPWLSKIRKASDAIPKNVSRNIVAKNRYVLGRRLW